MAANTTESPFEAMTAPFEAVAQGMNGQFGYMMKANADAGRQWLEGVNRISSELMTFSSNRLQHDMQAVQKLAECKNPNDAVKLQTECWSECVRDYMQEAQRLCELASDASSNYLSSLDGGGHSETKASSKAASETPEKAQTAE